MKGDNSRALNTDPLTDPARAGRLRLLLRAVFGGDVERRIVPVIAISFTYGASFSTFWVYVGVFAIEGLHWPAGRVGVLFLASAPAAAVANYLSGRLSDRVGRKRPIVASFLASTANMAVLASLGTHTPIAFALIVLQGVIGAPAYSLDRVLVADLVPVPDERENAYATVRVAANLGVLLGPPLAAFLVYVGGWTSFLLGIGVLGIAGALLTAGLLTETTGTPAAGQEVGSLRQVLRDRPFGLLLLSVLLAFVVYCGFETVLPVIAVSNYGLAPSTWGLLVVISPALVILGQLRLTRATGRIPPAPRLAGATLLMGLPFLALLLSSTVAVIAAVIVLFALGEMIWMPTSQTIAARLAPAPMRGTYFGALGAMTGPAWTLAPFVAFELRAHAGTGAVWLLFAVVAAFGALAGAAAVRAAATRAQSGRPPLPR